MLLYSWLGNDGTFWRPRLFSCLLLRHSLLSSGFLLKFRYQYPTLKTLEYYNIFIVMLHTLITYIQKDTFLNQMTAWVTLRKMYSLVESHHYIDFLLSNLKDNWELAESEWINLRHGEEWVRNKSQFYPGALESLVRRIKQIEKITNDLPRSGIFLPASLGHIPTLSK